MKSDLTYSSITTWQAEQYEVEIRFGVFSTVAEAAAMSQSGIKKVFIHGLGMWADLADGVCAPVRADGIIVRRLRSEAAAAATHRSLTIEDFETVPMTLDQMRIDADMVKGFGSQAFRVVDSAGNTVTPPSSN